MNPASTAKATTGNERVYPWPVGHTEAPLFLTLPCTVHILVGHLPSPAFFENNLLGSFTQFISYCEIKPVPSRQTLSSCSSRQVINCVALGRMINENFF
jgi:hypothetical protein